MSPPKSIGKLRIGRGVVTHVESRSFLHGKRMSNNSLVVSKVFSAYIVSRSDSNNRNQQ